MQLLALLCQDSSDSGKTAILNAISDVLVRRRPGWSYELRTSAQIIITLYHCLPTMLSPASGASSGLSAGLSLSVVEFILKLLRQRFFCYEAMMHAIPILILCVRSCPPERMDSMEPALEVFAALSHSRNFGLRCVVGWFFSVLGRAPPGVIYPGSPRAEEPPSPRLAESDVRPGGEHLTASDVRVRPGSEVALIEQCARDAHMLVRYLAEMGDFQGFGIALADVLVRGPLAYNDEDIAHIYAGWDSRLSPPTWPELLRTAAATLRADPSLLDKADVLDLEYITRADPWGAAASRAEQVLARNPAHAYAHAVFCGHASDYEAALQIARRALELDDLTPYLKRQFLYQAAELSCKKAFAILLNMNPFDSDKTRIGRHEMNLGLQYTYDYIKAAPGDCRDLPNVLDLCINMSIILGGPELGDDIGDIRTLTNALETSIRLLQASGYPNWDNRIRTDHRLYTRHFPQGFKKWKRVLTEFDRQDHAIRATMNFPPTRDCTCRSAPQDPGSSCTHRATEVGADWWKQSPTTIYSLLRGPLRCCCNRPRVQFGPDLVLLYRCTWCADATALVRKCTGCENAWYCNPTCQRADWPEHKGKCGQ
ncbi:hypothetical protein K466DRAFT_145209 [Polyporus arcularius HHB13444]|uniref:MYND-type domain-containing protein n=1 Tax=Polyporus arcularius HHB13444 TaxID=1314778 RepID=A0A5C3PTU6_9APHY|nr:hypothetical protein K466DRAFT_145209 [Polyporus arcularius HHB13444]